jgi:hypothetical protein
VDTLRSCLRIVEELGEILDEEELSVQVHAAVGQLNGHFTEALCLPDPRRRSTPPEGPRSSWGGIRRGMEAWEALMPQSARPPRHVGAA